MRVALESLQVGVYDLRLHEEGLYMTFWVGDRDEGTFGMTECFTAPGVGGLVMVMMYIFP